MELTNRERAKSYMAKQDMLGIKYFDFKIHSDDDVELVKVYDIDGKDMIVIPKFVNKIKVKSSKSILGVDIVSAFSGTRYTHIQIDGKLDTYEGIFAKLKSKEVVITAKYSNLVSNMNNMFNLSSCRYIDISGLDISNVRSMRNLFRGTYELVSVKMDGIDTSKVEDMSGMFWGSAIIDIDLSALNTSKVIDMSKMFSMCSKLRYVKLSMDTSKVKYMNEMFSNCMELERLGVRGINTSSVEDMSNMFSGCRNLRSLDISGFDLRNIKNIKQMFNKCERLSNLGVTSLSDIGLSNEVSGIGTIFDECYNIQIV